MDGEPHACVLVGNMYKEGVDVDESASTAFQLCETAAEQAYSPAYMKLYTCYREGIGTKQSYTMAQQMLDKGIEAGDADAQFPKGEDYRLGECGLQADEENAKVFLKRASDQKHNRATYTLAMMNRPPPVTVVEVPVQSNNAQQNNGQSGGGNQPMTYNEAISAYRTDLEERGYSVETEGGIDAGGNYDFDKGVLYGQVKLVLIVKEGTRPGYYPTFKSTFYDSKQKSLGSFTSNTSNLTRISEHLTVVSVVLDVPSYASFLRVSPRASGYFFYSND